MSLVFAGIASHAPGITGRANLVDPAIAQEFHGAYRGMAQRLAAARPDALIVVAAEHFANFFMNNMPSFAVGMADRYQGPIEDPQWLGIPHTSVPGSAALSRRLIRDMMQTVDLAYAEEWKFDHGIMVPLHFLTPRFDLPIVPMNINCQGPPLAPLHRAWAFGEALRRAADSVPERIGLVGTGGISHWPATPDSGKINEAWDLEFLHRWQTNDRTRRNARARSPPRCAPRAHCERSFPQMDTRRTVDALTHRFAGDHLSRRCRRRAGAHDQGQVG